MSIRHFGYNLKVTDMQAAIGCAQLEKLPGFHRGPEEELATACATGWPASKIASFCPEATENSDPSWFGFLLTVREGAGFNREQIVSHLEAKGIQTRMLFAGNLIKHPCFDEMRKDGVGYRVVGDLTNTDRIMRDTFWVGVYPGMTEEMVGYMVEAFTRFAAK